MFLYFLYYISSYYLLSRYSAIEFFLFYNAYDNDRNYYYKKMNNLFNFIVLIILLVGLHLFKIETLETIARFKYIVEFIRNHKNVFDGFSSSLKDLH